MHVKLNKDKMIEEVLRCPESGSSPQLQKTLLVARIIPLPLYVKN